jgi:RNA polymerase sigma factor (sigma-70 family)
VKQFSTIELLNQDDHYNNQMISLEETIPTWRNLTSHSPFFTGISDSEKVLLRLAFSSLTDRQRQVLEAICVEGYTEREVAAHLDINRAVVHRHLHRGLRNMRKVLLGDEA